MNSHPAPMLSLFSAAQIAERHGLKRSGTRWAGPCPKCGGSSGSDRFSLWENGAFKCFSCGFKGDAVTWLRVMEQMSCPDAHEAAGRECRSTTCPQRDVCRLGSGSGAAPGPRRPVSVQPPRGRQPRAVSEVTVRRPLQTWGRWAADLVERAAGRLAGNAAAMAWLSARGIDQAAAARARLGWLDHDSRLERKAIGLEPERDGKTRLWIPGGLLIPIMDEAGAVHRLRIRRTDEARDRFRPDLKYVWLEGSGNAPLVIESTAPRRGVVVVEAELDAIAVAAAHPAVAVIGIGTVAGGLSERLHRICAMAPVILVALDADDGRDSSGAGPRMVRTWLDTYRQARYWPVPSGKDPGDYAALGSLHEWVEAGLPPVVGHDRSFAPENYQKGEGGTIVVAPAPMPTGDPATEDPPLAEDATYTATLADGRTMHITADQGAWTSLAAEGAIVFSHNELSRVQEATATLPGPERERAALAVVDIKDVFGAAYVRAGRKPSTT